MEELYKELILELYKHPLNKGLLFNATHKHKQINPTCGDEVTVQLRIENEIIVDVMHTGDGCAISQAAVSLITDKIKGVHVSKIKAMNKTTMDELLGVDILPTRVKCEMLGLEAIKKALE